MFHIVDVISSKASSLRYNILRRTNMLSFLVKVSNLSLFHCSRYVERKQANLENFLKTSVYDSYSPVYFNSRS